LGIAVAEHVIRLCAANAFECKVAADGTVKNTPDVLPEISAPDCYGTVAAYTLLKHNESPTRQTVEEHDAKFPLHDMVSAPMTDAMKFVANEMTVLGMGRPPKKPSRGADA